jgi:hypothetical protein
MHFDHNAQALLDIHRRSFLRQSGVGLGCLALAQMAGVGQRIEAAPSGGKWRGVISPPHLPIKAKRVIHLCMAGGPSQFETFDWKPELKKHHGQAFPESLTRGQQLAQLQNTKLLSRGSFTKFRRHGQSGQEISDLLPHTATIADRICIIRSMVTEQINAARAWVRGFCTASARTPTTCRASSC